MTTRLLTEVPFEVIGRAGDENLFEIFEDGGLEGVFDVEDEKDVTIGS